MAKLSHLDAKGKARMVDVGDKPVTAREALARGEITMSATALRLIRKGAIAKGDPLQVARLAGIMAAKKKPFETWSVADLDVDAADVGLSAAWSIVEDVTKRPPRTSGQVVTDEGDGGVRLVEYLAAQKFV